MNANSEYRYRLWGINWFPLFSLSLASTGLWGFLKYYDSTRPEELIGLGFKIAGLAAGWLCLWLLIKAGKFYFRFPFYLAWGLAALWEIGQSVYLHDGFRFLMSIALSILFYTTYQWIENCLELASVNPNLSWFVGKLTPIPLVQVHFSLSDEDIIYPAKVRTIDQTGAFILFDQTDLSQKKLNRKKGLNVQLKFKDRQIEIKGRPIAELSWEQRGLGLQFSFEDLYHESQYTSLVQQIKGEGLA